MPVTRSALASSAARAACAASAPTSGAISLRQPPQPPHPIALAAELRMERDGIQRRHARRPAASAVQIPEMPRIGEARAQHAFVAGDDRRAAVIGLDIGDEGEPRRSRACRIAQREIALVDAHRHLHHFGRQVHGRGVDPAEQRHRPFHQAGHFVQQPGHPPPPTGPRRRPARATPRRSTRAVRPRPPARNALASFSCHSAPTPPRTRRAPGSDGLRSCRPMPVRARHRRPRAGRTAPPRHPGGRRCGAAGGPR